MLIMGELLLLLAKIMLLEFMINKLKLLLTNSKVCNNMDVGIKWHTHGHNNRIFSLKFMPDDSNIIASGGWDQNV